MEAFEGFVALAMEAEKEVQHHGYEVDLVGARANRLVLATVKSYFGSRGVIAEHVTGETTNANAGRRYSLLNRPEVRAPVIRAAARRYGYKARDVELRLYVGKVAIRWGSCYLARKRQSGRTGR